MLTVVLGISYRALNISDVENKCMDKGERMGVGWMGDWDWHIYTIDLMYKIGIRTNENLLYSSGNSSQYTVVT